jgi:type I restriction enzyme, S subunit
VTTVGDLLVEYAERPTRDSEPPVLTLTERNGFVRQEDRFHKRLATADTSNYKIVRRHDIAFNPYLLWAGAIAQNTIVDEGVISPLYPTFRVREGFDPRYVARLLLTQQLISAYDGIAFGSVPRRRRSSVRDFLALHLPSQPSFEEQQRIAGVLDQADDIRAKRRQVLAHLDALTQSIFNDMFGDPITNSRRLPRATIGSIAEVVTGNTPSRSDSTNFGDAIEWIKSDNLGGSVATRAEEWLSEHARARARIAPAGSILVTCIAGSSTSIGKSSLVDRDVAFNQQINAIIPSSKVDAQFILGQLKTAPDLVRAKSTGGMKGLVSKSSFKSIEILLPDFSVQRKFVARVEHVNARRAVVQRALVMDDELFTSLQSRAFKGEL